MTLFCSINFSTSPVSMKLRIASFEESTSNRIFANSLVGNLHATSKRMAVPKSVCCRSVNCTPECMAVKLQSGDREAVPA